MNETCIHVCVTAQLWSCLPGFSESEGSQLSDPEGLQLRGDQEAAVGVRRPQAQDQA